MSESAPASCRVMLNCRSVKKTEEDVKETLEFISNIQKETFLNPKEFGGFVAAAAPLVQEAGDHG